MFFLVRAEILSTKISGKPATPRLSVAVVVLVITAEQRRDVTRRDLSDATTSQTRE